jgi:hypothetical protein
MKTAIRPLQFSSYPLQVNATSQVKKAAPLVAVKKDKEKVIRIISANDPANWDNAWFCNYE